MASEHPNSNKNDEDIISPLSEIEFSVQMLSLDSEEQIYKSLEGVGDINIDTIQGRVIVKTSLPWINVQEKIENTGRRAVLSGFGSQSAVVMINTGCKHVKGVVRFMAHNNQDGCIVDGVIDGLSSGEHSLHIHECGDISKGCENIGSLYHNEKLSSDAVGNLGRITANENGRATFKLSKKFIPIWDIIGRSLVVKPISTNIEIEEERMACGIIARAAGIFQNYKKICACDGVSLWDERDLPLAGAKRQQK